MLNISRSHSVLWLLPLFLVLVLVLSCGSDNQMVGTYRAETKESAKQAEVLVELKANGEGTWKMGEEEVPFSWYLKRGELRVNTKGGGVIVGTIDKDVIHMTLPGTGGLSFKKVQ